MASVLGRSGLLVSNEGNQEIVDVVRDKIHVVTGPTVEKQLACLIQCLKSQVVVIVIVSFLERNNLVKFIVVAEPFGLLWNYRAVVLPLEHSKVGQGKDSGFLLGLLSRLLLVVVVGKENCVFKIPVQVPPRAVVVCRGHPVLCYQILRDVSSSPIKWFTVPLSKVFRDVANTLVRTTIGKQSVNIKALTLLNDGARN
jgi:hypothetical protein